MRFELAARQAAAEELAAWLERGDLGDGIRLVTGDPGAGKSRLLARTAAAADADARGFVAVADGSLPPVGAFGGGADGDGGTGAEWLRWLADGMGLGDRIRYDGDVSGLTLALRKDEHPQAVLLSGAPGRLRVTVRRSAGVPELVRKLIDPVTAKRPGGGLALLLVEVDRTTLAELLWWKPKLAASVIDLDQGRFAPDRAAFAAWVRSLIDVPDSVFAGREGDAASAAAAVTAAAWPNFLVAEVLAGELRARSGAVGTLPESLEGAWEFVLDGFGQDAARARRLLAPVVLAEGVVGMPGELRRRAAAAVTGDRVTSAELNAFEGVVASFVAADVVEGAGAVPDGYARLRHGALAEAAAASFGSGVTEVQRRITTALREVLPDDVAAVARGRVLTASEDYVLRFGVGHALGGGLLDEWLADLRVLVLGDPEALAEAVAAGDRTEGAAARRRGAVAEAVRAYRSDSRCGVIEWVARLRFAGQAWGDEDLVRALDGLGLTLPWRAEWARWRPLGAFDAREFGPGWTGPVEVVGWRGATGAEGAVCLRSAYDRKYRWYALADGAQEGEAVEQRPETADALAVVVDGDGSTVAVSDGGSDLLRVEVHPGTGTDGVVLSLCAPYPGAQAYPLPGGRLLLAGHSGLALLRFGPSAGAPAGGPAGGPAERATEPVLLPREAWWTVGALTADDLQPYYQGGIAVAGPGALGALAELPDAVQVLCTIGLPGFPVFWQDTLGSLETLRSLEEYLEEEGAESEVDASGYTVIAVAGDGESALCVEHGTGRVVQAFDGEPEVVNTSLMAFAACQALATWALSVSTGRQVAERYEFLAFVRAALRRVDPVAAEGNGADWWWFQAIEDDYTLLA